MKNRSKLMTATQSAIGIVALVAIWSIAVAVLGFLARANFELFIFGWRTW